MNEAVNYIKVLEETLEKLERKKQERAEGGLKQIMGTTSGAVSVSGKQKVAFDKTWAASNMVLNIQGNEAQFSICSVHKPGLMTNIASVLEKHNIELISATISANGNGSTCMIQVHVSFTNFIPTMHVSSSYILNACLSIILPYLSNLFTITINYFFISHSIYFLLHSDA